MASPAMVQAIGVLIGEAVAAGVNISAIMRAAEENGDVPPEMWAEIVEEVERAEARWNAAGR